MKRQKNIFEEKEDFWDLPNWVQEMYVMDYLIHMNSRKFTQESLEYLNEKLKFEFKKNDKRRSR